MAIVIKMAFLSIQAQDFIEDGIWTARTVHNAGFLSIQAQDFIEEQWTQSMSPQTGIPEHSSSGLH